MAKIKNLLLDRDGTIIVEKHYLRNPDHVELLPNAKEALKKFTQRGIDLFIVTNQSGIGRGYFKIKDFFAVQNKLYDLLKDHNVKFKGVEFCPHAPYDNCSCRKPAIGMWKNLKEKYGLLEEETAIVGDKLSDMYFGINAGLLIKGLVLTGYGLRERERCSNIKIEIVAKDLLDFYYLLEQKGLI